MNIIKPIQLILFIILNLILSQAQAFNLKSGDLLFQELHCLDLCSAINLVTLGYNEQAISHVGIVIKVKNNFSVIEAIGSNVTLTPLNIFLKRSLDQNKNPQVIVGRVEKNHQYLIPSAISFAESKLGDIYNDSFYPDHKGYYCSSLIYKSFKAANGGKDLFNLYKMNFKASNKDYILPAWQAYFDKLGLKVPQGKDGSNPAELSRDPKIKIIYSYGKIDQLNSAAIK